MKSAIRVALALTFFSLASECPARIVETEISPTHQVVVRDLIGLSPAQAQIRLTGFNADWPKIMSFEVLTSHGVLSFAVLDEFVQDAASIEITARGRNRATDIGMPKVWSRCTVVTDDDTGYDTLLMFRDNKLEGVWGKPTAAEDSMAASADAQLPLEDGEHFMDHWGRALLNKDAAIIVRCARHESVSDRPLASGPARAPSASDMQGLALLPFAAELPLMNADRTAERRRGVALYEQLSPGYALQGGLRTFLSAHTVAGVVRSRDQNYAILKIDLGAYEGRNLGNSDDFGLVGVRDGVVQWRALDYSRASPRLPAETHH